ncbi:MULTISPECIES: YoaK family protein [unclassified Pseudomonas]|uniref:YoaK family protein n=1 Tax=unclassified Pseudomonas TaxID=196821 RepID=UPI00244925AA|nr:MULTISPECIES: YoaK family protein [unclassified Pseudomonas]MDH0300945.1 YoaK family protein [Pseudomonas sp. GD04091]MDH1983523.1 YoaK family protein [Pseudomonas sp. GD03689]
MLPTAASQHSARRTKLQALRGRVGLGLVAGLSVLAGMTDAIGLLALGDFVSFMSGNTTRLAVAISQVDLALILRLAVAIFSFVLGNALGVLLARLSRRRAAPLLLIVAALLAFAAGWPTGATFPALIAATLAMGMLNAVVEHVNGLPIGLTYVTGALSRFGRGLGRWMLGERRHGWRVQLVPWTGMLLGAALGAWLQQRFGLLALSASCGLACILALLTRFIPRAWQLGYMPR